MLFLFWFVFVKIFCLLVSGVVNKFLHQKIRLRPRTEMGNSEVLNICVVPDLPHVHLIPFSPVIFSAMKSVPRPPADDMRRPSTSPAVCVEGLCSFSGMLCVSSSMVLDRSLFRALP